MVGRIAAVPLVVQRGSRGVPGAVPERIQPVDRHNHGVTRFFHVDRASALHIDQLLALTRPDELPDENKIADSALQAHVEELFPEGLTAHGMGYLFWQNNLPFPLQPGLYDAASLGAMRSHAIELIAEYVRRTHYADRPSRYQSIFCWATPEDASRFIQAVGATGAPIWEIEGEQVFKADMNLLTAGTALATSLAAHRYWRGEPLPHGTPHWESFVAPGARVVGRLA